MRGKFIVRTLLPALVVFLAAAASASGAQQAPKASMPKPPAKKPLPVIEAVIEPKAVEILKAACSRLAAARAMKFTAVVSYEAPSRFGPALVYTTKSEVTSSGPTSLRSSRRPTGLPPSFTTTARR